MTHKSTQVLTESNSFYLTYRAPLSFHLRLYGTRHASKKDPNEHKLIAVRGCVDTMVKSLQDRKDQ